MRLVVSGPFAGIFSNCTSTGTVLCRRLCCYGVVGVFVVRCVQSRCGLANIMQVSDRFVSACFIALVLTNPLSPFHLN